MSYLIFGSGVLLIGRRLFSVFISSADTKEGQAKLVALVEGLTARDPQPVPALFSSLGQEIT